MKFKYLFIASLIPILCQGQVVKSFKQSANGVQVDLAEGTLNLISIAENAVRIKYYIGEEAELPELVFIHKENDPNLRVAESSSELELKGQKIIITVDKQSGKLSFADNEGKIFLSEAAGSRKLTPDSILGEPCFIAEQNFGSGTISGWTFQYKTSKPSFNAGKLPDFTAVYLFQQRIRITMASVRINRLQSG
ncbi:MAG: DUF4968 domain-containing protein [bacterium]